MKGLTRRETLAAMGAALLPGAARAARPGGYLVENAMRLFRFS